MSGPEWRPRRYFVVDRCSGLSLKNRRRKSGRVFGGVWIGAADAQEQGLEEAARKLVWGRWVVDGVLWWASGVVAIVRSGEKQGRAGHSPDRSRRADGIICGTW
ncbi:hypothetical protein EX30DRAFT_200989 [Ascodesmis nigricans]|uniref:Uncharacterized protein n=1 Tax=Ascodesmis nigricans TaxID=341454 RepID=A0A4S2MKT3_9PEZI|nr:hypothetical protein EX30DRAFT_200989 [Ascodesmis nigricans]